MKLMGRTVLGVLNFNGGPLHQETLTLYSGVVMKPGVDVLLVSHPAPTYLGPRGTNSMAVIQNRVIYKEYAGGWHLSAYRLTLDVGAPLPVTGQVLKYIETYSDNDEIQTLINSIAPGEARQINNQWLKNLSDRINHRLKISLRAAPSYCADHIKAVVDDVVSVTIGKIMEVCTIGEKGCNVFVADCTNLDVVAPPKKGDVQAAVDEIAEATGLEDEEEEEEEEDEEEGDPE